MKLSHSFTAVAALLVGGVAAFAQDHGTTGPGVPAFVVRPGYTVTLAADNINGDRFIEFGDGTDLYVSEPDSGRILKLSDPDGSGKYTKQSTFVSGYKTVHGLEWYKGTLWFTQSGEIHNVKPKADGTAGEVQDVDCGELPSGGGHWFRSILVDDTGFYTSIGDDQNASDHTKDDREKIWRYNLDGSGKKLFAAGLRNTEKLRFRPGTTEVWGCDHGSDNYGAYLGEHKNGAAQPTTDLFPPDKLNHYVEGGFYGHPFILPFHIPRPEYANRPDILEIAAKTIPPAWNNGAHWANNGWNFMTKPTLTGQAGDIVVAFHGSWNSQKRVGYCVQRIEFDPVTGNPCGTTTLVKCIGADGSVLARPVDIAEAPDGSVLFSSDSSKAIYRLTRDAAMR